MGQSWSSRRQRLCYWNFDQGFSLGPKAAGVGQCSRNRDMVLMLLGWLELIRPRVQIMLGGITYLINGQQVKPELKGLQCLCLRRFTEKHHWMCLAPYAKICCWVPTLTISSIFLADSQALSCSLLNPCKCQGTLQSPTDYWLLVITWLMVALYLFIVLNVRS